MNFDNSEFDQEYEVSISINRPIFHISAVAKMTGIHQQTLRSYEKQGIIRPARSDGNTRLYSVNEIERLRQVLNLVNELGVNLAGAEVILKLKEQINDLHDQLNNANKKIEKLISKNDYEGR